MRRAWYRNDDDIIPAERPGLPCEIEVSATSRLLRCPVLVPVVVLQLCAASLSGFCKLLPNALWQDKHGCSSHYGNRKSGLWCDVRLSHAPLLDDRYLAGAGKRSAGASAARVFSEAGYRVALIAEDRDYLRRTVDHVKEEGGEAVAVTLEGCQEVGFAAPFAFIKQTWPGSPFRVAVLNVGPGSAGKPFLNISDEALDESLMNNVSRGFRFAREAICSFQDETLNEQGKRGTMVFTGTMGLSREHTATSALCHFGLRGLSQSLAKEFEKDKIHVVHAVFDGGIWTDGMRTMNKKEDKESKILPESIAKACLGLAKQQHRSAMPWELNLRPLTNYDQ